MSAGPGEPAEATGHRQVAWTIATPGRGFVDITGRTRAFVTATGARNGGLTLFIRHTSASLLIQENTDPDVQADLIDALDLVAPRQRRWRHALEGPDDMPAHVKAMLLPTSLTIPVVGGTLALGTWQAIYVVEHRDRPHARDVIATYSGTLQTAGAASGR